VNQAAFDLGWLIRPESVESAHGVQKMAVTKTDCARSLDDTKKLAMSYVKPLGSRRPDIDNSASYIGAVLSRGIVAGKISIGNRSVNPHLLGTGGLSGREKHRLNMAARGGLDFGPDRCDAAFTSDT
jgi:hypothetical protein